MGDDLAGVVGSADGGPGVGQYPVTGIRDPGCAGAARGTAPQDVENWWHLAGVFASGVAGFLIGLRGLQWVSPRHANSFLDIPGAALMSVGFAALLVTILLHTSVRYDKRDPFLIPHTISSAGTVALAWWGAQKWGVTGVVIAYAAVAGLFTLPVAMAIAVRHARRPIR